MATPESCIALGRVRLIIYKVLERMGECVYQIKGLKGKKSQCVHFDRLKP